MKNELAMPAALALKGTRLYKLSGEFWCHTELWGGTSKLAMAPLLLLRHHVLKQGWQLYRTAKPQTDSWTSQNSWFPCDRVPLAELSCICGLITVYPKLTNNPQGSQSTPSWAQEANLGAKPFRGPAKTVHSQACSSTT